MNVRLSKRQVSEVAFQARHLMGNHHDHGKRKVWQGILRALHLGLREAKRSEKRRAAVGEGR